MKWGNVVKGNGLMYRQTPGYLFVSKNLFAKVLLSVKENILFARILPISQMEICFNKLVFLCKLCAKTLVLLASRTQTVSIRYIKYLIRQENNENI